MLSTAFMSGTAKRISFPADLAHSAELRSATKAFFAQAGFDTVWTGRLMLVADELFMNAVKYGCEPGDEIEIELVQSDDRVRFAITDTGASGITAEELREKIERHGATHTPTKTSGRGLAIITHAWTDGYEITDAPMGGLIVSFVKLLTADPTKNTTTEIKSDKQNESFIIALTGDVDESNLMEKTAAIENFIEQNPAGQLALDLTDVNFINSSFIGRLAGWHSELAGNGGTLAILNASPPVHEILTLVGLDKVLSINTKN
jgi:anti-anti-sigma factor